METRISTLAEKCKNAVDRINKLNVQAQEFPKKLNCDPSELKSRFLDGMRELDEYIYVLTDFNLSLQNFIDGQSQSDSAPVLDVNRMQSPIQPTRVNLLDALSELSTSHTIAANVQGTLPKQMAKKKLAHRISFEDKLIDFSSASASIESVHNDKNPEGDNQNYSAATSMVLEHDIAQWDLPQQSILSIDTVHDAIIVNVDARLIWIITCNTSNDLAALFTNMQVYYNNKSDFLTIDQLRKISYCAYYDLEVDMWYRCYLLNAVYRENAAFAEVYLVDTGETKAIPNDKIYALAKEFCQFPPFARSCHLAGIEFVDQSPQFESKILNFLKEFIHANCKIEVDDNSSEDLGVYVAFRDGQCLNWMLVNIGLAIQIDEHFVQNNSAPKAVTEQMASCKLEEIEPEIANPEYEDALVAVTGYHNRDEIDICKHYNGGPSKTCFKGSRCTKRHVVMHPDGWTLDKVEAVYLVRNMPLPAVGERRKVRVTFVQHFNRFYVQYIEPENTPARQRPFGVMAPPTTLEELIGQMNSRAALASYRPLELIPAYGELVAALYPHDRKWYRARILELSRRDQNVLVQYIDYGTEGWVSESMVSSLEGLYRTLPCQSVACTLLEVKLRSSLATDMKLAKEALTKIAQDKLHEILVLSQSVDELEVSLFDCEGVNVSQRLAATGLVDYKPCSVDYDLPMGSKRKVVP